MHEITLMRVAGERASLEDWNLGSGALGEAITRELQDRLDIFFSEDGANALLEITLDDDVMMVSCEICIEQYQAYAKGKTTLLELLEWTARMVGDGDDDFGRRTVAAQLRLIADKLDPNAELKGAGAGRVEDK